MAATVVLLHRVPDGSQHFDWLFQRPGGGPLITFRLTARPDRPPPWRETATRLPDHREVYLTFEGELSGARGQVRRVASGECNILLDEGSAFRARLHLGNARGELSGRLTSKALWELELRPAEPF